MPEKRMLGTGRMNLTGGAATITMPVEAVELWDVDETGKDVVWFTDETKIYAARREDVSVDD